MKKPLYFIPFLVILITLSCQQKAQRKLAEVQDNTFGLPIQSTYNVLFDENDSISVGLKLVPTKGNHDMTVYIPINGSSTHGYLVVSHEVFTKDSILGDGGGATFFEVQKQGENWNVIGQYKNIDFSPVKHTVYNCGGKLTPKGTILMAEEYFPQSNSAISTLDTINNQYQDFGWVVEVDPMTQKAVQKLKSLGRYKHEDIYPMPDRKTLYITNDDDPSFLFKFIADTLDVYTKGKLYAFSESDTVPWVLLPNDSLSLQNIGEVANQLKATIFIRHEWMTVVNNVLYITETGKDEINWQKQMKLGGQPASYFKLKKDSTFKDPYGRILALDLKTNKIKVLLEGMPEFANPDCITSLIIKGTPYLVVAEDIIGKDKKRSNKKHWGNQLWLINLTTLEKKVIMQAPKGSELTGIVFTPDRKTMFVNIQHPADKKENPIRVSSTLAIQGIIEDN